MTESFIQNMFAERIGGDRFGKDTAIYKFERIKRAKAAARKEHPDTKLIDMGVGEPDSPAYPVVVQTLAEEAGKPENRFYADNGIPAFYKAASAYMKELFDVDIDPDSEICHCIGAKSALSMLPASFINPGECSVLTVPGYPVLGTWTRYMGGEVLQLPLKKENSFLPDLSALTPDQVKRTKLLYLNYPNNPTGASATECFFDDVIAFAKANNIIIIQDAAYAALNFTGKPLSILSRPGAKEVSVELHSMSKGFNMTGWRLGWVCGNPSVVSAFAAVKDNSDSGQFRAIQKAAIKALQNQSDITQDICTKYHRRLTLLTSELKEAGFDAKVPEGSFYMYVDIPKGTKDGVTFESGEAFSEWLIRNKQISTVPWDDVGHFVRFSATFEAADEAAERAVLAEVGHRLKEADLVF